ncbi:MAG: DUF2953 domain-containing protein [Lachnospiraceae bacterium]
MILTVLKVIGIILLCIIGFILFLLLLVLLAPISYQVEFSYKKNDFRLNIKASWLAVIRVYVRMLEGELSYKVKALFFTILNSDKQEKTGKTEPEAVRNTQPLDNTEVIKNETQEAKTKAVDSYEANVTEEVTKESSDESVSDTVKESKFKAVINKIKLIISKIKHPADIYDFLIRKWMNFTKKIDKICDEITSPDNREVVLLVLEQIKTLFRHIKPRKHKLYVKAGFSDPSVTGQVLGAYSVINSILHLNFILEPDFNNEVLEAEGKIKGRIRILNLLIILIKLYSNKTIRKWIRRK